MKKTAAVLALSGCLGATRASAHHAMGGETPTSLVEGVLSGLAHPVIGIDHLAFVVALGIAAAYLSRSRTALAVFVAATVAGCALLVAGFEVPGLEIGVSTSVVLVGGLVVSGRHLGTAAVVAVFALAGLLHGMAYGGAIVGAESTPLFAYLVGFACVQYAIALAAGRLVRRGSEGRASLHPRLAGAVALGIGVAILIDTIEGLFFVA